MLERIISGAQTGADRGGLDAALADGLSVGGWIPRGRRAEDGRIPVRYVGLTETPTADYRDRTGRNVRDSDATLLFTHGPLAGGSALTAGLCRKHRKPCLHVDLAAAPDPLRVAGLRRPPRHRRALILPVLPRSPSSRSIRSGRRSLRLPIRLIRLAPGLRPGTVSAILSPVAAHGRGATPPPTGEPRHPLTRSTYN